MTVYHKFSKFTNEYSVIFPAEACEWPETETLEVGIKEMCIGSMGQTDATDYTCILAPNSRNAWQSDVYEGS